LIVARKFATACILGVFFAACAISQPARSPQSSASHSKPTATSAQQPPDETDLPEEDETVKPRVYTYDPIEAERNIKVGKFYMHQGGDRGYRAAAGRFQDATKYDPKSAEAFFLLGQAEQKLKHKEKAEAAFHHVIALSPDSKLAKEAQKKLGTS
jgi:tetratricopeptide (TPR) repeat protein